MRNTTLSLLTLACLAQFPAAAQSAANQQYQKEMGRAARSSDFVENQFEPSITQQETPQSKEKQFVSKTQEFAALWTALAREYNEKGTFNMKLAKEVTKAFHALEKSEGWPKVGGR